MNSDRSHLRRVINGSLLGNRSPELLAVTVTPAVSPSLSFPSPLFNLQNTRYFLVPAQFAEPPLSIATRSSHRLP